MTTAAKYEPNLAHIAELLATMGVVTDIKPSYLPIVIIKAPDSVRAVSAEEMASWRTYINISEQPEQPFQRQQTAKEMLSRGEMPPLSNGYQFVIDRRSEGEEDPSRVHCIF